MMKKAMLFALILLLAGCGARRELPDAGTFTDGVYRNDFFGLTIQVSGDVNVKTHEELEALRHSLEAVTKQRIRGEGLSGTGKILLTVQRSRPVVPDSVWRYTLSVIAERLDRRAGIENSEHYAAAAIAARGSDLSVPVMQPVYVSGREFIRYGLLRYGTIEEMNYIRVEHDHALILVLTYDTASPAPALDLLGGIQFDQ